MRLKTVLCCGAAIVTMAAGSANAATTINLVDNGFAGTPQQQAQFREGFRIAAAYWSSILTNNVTINLGVGTASLGSGIIGSTGSTRADYSVANWETRINATKSGSTLDQGIVLPSLNGAGGTGIITNGTTAAGNDDTATQRYINGTTTSTQVLYMNSSVIKAIGGTASGVNSGSIDGNVQFSTNFNFDFNPTDGITANTFDFIGVAIHEIGHALGFVSGVDFLDYYGTPNGPGRTPGLGYSLNNTSIYSALDMFRFSTDPNNLAPGTNPALDLAVGGTKYFSIDGGATALFGNTFSTGRYNGDGQQASHWKDATGVNQCGPQLGIMDPTFCFGQTGFVTGLDLAAFDAMGWNLSVNALNYSGASTGSIYTQFATGVPEPTTWAMMMIGFGLVGGAMRRRSTKVAFAV